MNKKSVFILIAIVLILSGCSGTATVLETESNPSQAGEVVLETEFPNKNGAEKISPLSIVPILLDSVDKLLSQVSMAKFNEIVISGEAANWTNRGFANLTAFYSPNSVGGGFAFKRIEINGYMLEIIYENGIGDRADISWIQGFLPDNYVYGMFNCGELAEYVEQHNG